MHTHTVIGTERRVQVIGQPVKYVFEQYEHWTEPQVNLSLLSINSIKFQPQDHKTVGFASGHIFAAILGQFVQGVNVDSWN
jgi:hypothetical protein